MPKPITNGASCSMTRTDSMLLQSVRQDGKKYGTLASRRPTERGVLVR
jgi:hypothetical protein